MNFRKADKAGTWYPDSPAALRNEVRGCIARALRLHGAPAPPSDGKQTTAVLVPHAGLAFSGSVAAAAYSLLRDSRQKIDVFILFGACHAAHLRKPALWTQGAWETPLGPVRIDEQLADRFLGAEIGQDNPDAHLGDNAIELQLPFIKCLFPEAEILPVAMSPFSGSAQTGARASRLAADFSRETGKTAVAVASTDLTHYGAAFGLMPAGAGEAALEWVRENDSRFLDALLGLELERIVPVALRDESACGAGAAAAAAGWAQERGCAAGRLLAHANSHAAAPQGLANHIVGYAAAAFDA